MPEPTVNKPNFLSRVTGAVAGFASGALGGLWGGARKFFDGEGWGGSSPGDAGGSFIGVAIIVAMYTVVPLAVLAYNAVKGAIQGAVYGAIDGASNGVKAGLNAMVAINEQEPENRFSDYLQTAADRESKQKSSPNRIQRMINTVTSVVDYIKSEPLRPKPKVQHIEMPTRKMRAESEAANQPPLEKPAQKTKNKPAIDNDIIPNRVDNPLLQSQINPAPINKTIPKAPKKTITPPTPIVTAQPNYDEKYAPPKKTVTPSTPTVNTSPTQEEKIAPATVDKSKIQKNNPPPPSMNVITPQVSAQQDIHKKEIKIPTQPIPPAPPLQIDPNAKSESSIKIAEKNYSTQRKGVLNDETLILKVLITHPGWSIKQEPPKTQPINDNNSAVNNQTPVQNLSELAKPRILESGTGQQIKCDLDTISTTSTDEATFALMLELYQIQHPNEKPKITTDTQVEFDLWKKVSEGTGAEIALRQPSSSHALQQAPAAPAENQEPEQHVSHRM